jgi:hypothetical protein
MKKLLFLIQLTASVILYSAISYGDDDGEGRGRGYEHHGHYREGYYPQQPRQRYQDPRSTQGLAGGVIGSVLGYQMGSGDPVVTGLGAAAGSYLGNGMGGR